MTKINFEQIIHRFRILLISRGPLTAAESCQLLKLSQASFSRLTHKMSGTLVLLGNVRSRKYALKKLLTQVTQPTPLYCVTEKGQIKLIGYLHALEPKGFFLEAQHNHCTPQLFSDLPYFLEDLRPSGFLGRLIPKTHPELTAPPSILDWSSEDCLRYWTKFGWNLIGNLILGDPALQLYLQSDSHAHPHSMQSATSSYPHHAQSIQSQGEVGSSAGGEQPKFLVNTHTQSAALVKFSPPLRDAISRRVADLLICEHFSHEILSQAGFETTASKIIFEENQYFLEIIRFDRTKTGGRKGLISLKSLSLEFIGSLDSWSKIASQLVQKKLISIQNQSKIKSLELFGQLIGNTDMHTGNLSFYLEENLTLGDLAPVYDMLPMMYYPRQNQIFTPHFEPPLPTPETVFLWKKMHSLALLLWQRTTHDSRISSEFRAIAAQNFKILEIQYQHVARVLDTEKT